MENETKLFNAYRIDHYDGRLTKLISGDNAECGAEVMADMERFSDPDKHLYHHWVVAEVSPDIEAMIAENKEAFRNGGVR